MTMPDPMDTALVERLCRAFAGLESADEARAFLSDLCTIKEVQEMASRLETARLLSQGASYQDVQAQVATSAATIARVSKALNYGSGGYQRVLE